jgi:hypothetical protein
MDSSAQIIWGVLFGAIGLGFFTYGRRQKAAVPFLVGIAMFVFPYFVTNAYVMVLIGILLAATPYFVRL